MNGMSREALASVSCRSITKPLPHTLSDCISASTVILWVLVVPSDGIGKQGVSNNQETSDQKYASLPAAGSFNAL